MVFESENVYIEPIQMVDVENVVEIYNSNTQFLRHHIRDNQVTFQWVVEELESMKSLGFSSCKVLRKDVQKIVGIIDFKIDEESYLSLLMIHKDYANRGFGKQIYKAFEEYAISRHSKRIRLDVVTGYNDKVFHFWLENGFDKVENITLNWMGISLPAITMEKNLYLDKSLVIVS
ncbi:GNAT family N-acetyltransferase [Alicyclobacillus fastidiosus]|uniref:GNAT family N-acetyltransferase n=1 Tax=Alicyclobacillus fastidiosus TaxID=392011 RepID=A0ABY6ZAW6_9BACL|nr:GNAT family N-acetyltransferase [Alicyclobacillus fastidiosus]WAH40024.1 GNAT family N-acetyltransferase [Alicyclobacillus fastidiosus]